MLNLGCLEATYTLRNDIPHDGTQEQFHVQEFMALRASNKELATHNITRSLNRSFTKVTSPHVQKIRDTNHQAKEQTQANNDDTSKSKIFSKIRRESIRDLQKADLFGLLLLLLHDLQSSTRLLDRPGAHLHAHKLGHLLHVPARLHHPSSRFSPLQRPQRDQLLLPTFLIPFLLCPFSPKPRN